jgi:hypothetical protein
MEFIKRVVAIGVGIAIFGSCLGAVEIKDDKDAIVVVGKEMSNVRYMLEVFGLIGTNVEYKAPKDRLKKSMDEFENSINSLIKKYPNTQISVKLKASLTAWKSVKKDLIEAFTKASQKNLKQKALDIHSRIRDVIKNLEEAKDLIIKKSKLQNIKELNSAIDISTSIRRVTSHYIMKMWQLKDSTIKEHWDEGLNIYRESLQALESSKFNKDDNFKSLLNQIKSEYEFFLMLKKMSRDDKYTPALIQEHSKKANDANSKIIEKILSSK